MTPAGLEALHRGLRAAARKAVACPRTIAASVKEGGTEPTLLCGYRAAAARAAPNSSRLD